MRDYPNRETYTVGIDHLLDWNTWKNERVDWYHALAM